MEHEKYAEAQFDKGVGDGIRPRATSDDVVRGKRIGESRHVEKLEKSEGEKEESHEVIHGSRPDKAAMNRLDQQRRTQYISQDSQEWPIR